MPAGELVPDVLVGTCRARAPGPPPSSARGTRRRSPRCARRRRSPKLLGQQAADRERVERGHQLRRVRSPDAPKMTRMHGSGRRRSCSPSSSGFCACCHRSRILVAAFALDAWTAWPPNWLRSAAFTFAANDSSCRDAKRANSAARDHRHRHVLGDRLGDRPAALAGVLDVAADLLEVAALRLERGVQQLEQPRADDRAVAPDAGDLVQVEVELRLLASPRSPRRTPASARTRSRCGPSSRSGPAPAAPTCA